MTWADTEEASMHGKNKTKKKQNKKTGIAGKLEANPGPVLDDILTLGWHQYGKQRQMPMNGRIAQWCSTALYHISFPILSK